MKRRILSLLLALTMLPMLFACTETPHESQSERESESQSESDLFSKESVSLTLKEAEPYVRLLGRSYFDGNSLVCDHVGDGVAFRLCLDGALSLTVTSDGDSYFTVYVDGERTDTRFRFPDGKSTAVLLEGTDDEIHEIRLVSQSEAQMSLSTLDRISFFGAFEAPPAEREYYIECIGDSISTGYGNLLKSGETGAGESLTQDGTRAFPFLAAEALNADIAVTGCSGIGAAHGWHSFTMEDFFSKSSYYRDPEIEYEPTRTPDLVVISLGTNDVGAPPNPLNVDNPEDRARLQQAFLDLVIMIEEQYGTGIPIVFVYGIMTARLDDFIPEMVREFGGDASNVYALKMNTAKSGGAGHPSLEEHVLLGEDLVTFICEKELLE